MVENVKIYDLEESIKASKYPMSVDNKKLNGEITGTVQNLAHSPKGEGHDQFLTGIRVAFDLTCTNKMWVEAERYRFLEFVSSQSTMHRMAKFDLDNQYINFVDPEIIKIVKEKRDRYLDSCKKLKACIDDKEKEKLTKENRKLYLELIYSNPAGFKITARMTTNYRCLKTIYSQRKNHRLPEWREFCKWIETLPYFEELINN